MTFISPINSQFLGPPSTDPSRLVGTANLLAGGKIFYIDILKNATNSILSLPLNWTRFDAMNDSLLDHRQGFVILREPIYRWISGISQVLHGCNFTGDEIDIIGNDVFHNVLYQRINFNPHVQHQCQYLRGFKTTNLTFFWHDKNLSNNIESFFREHNINVTVPHKHDKNDVPEKVKLNDYFKELLEVRKDYVKKLTDFYFDDYEIIKQVKFYGSPKLNFYPE